MQLHEETAINTYEIPLEQQISALESSSDFQGDTPTVKLSKDELISNHLKNISLLKSASNSTEPKSLILPAAYAPSTASLNDLQKACTGNFWRAPY